MYKLLDKIGFKKVIGNYFGNADIKDNYIEFIRTLDITQDEIKAAYATPAGKALNKALGNQFKPVVKKVDKINKHVIVEWIKK